MDLNDTIAAQRQGLRPRDTNRSMPRIQFDPSIPVARIQQAAEHIGCKVVATPDGLRIIPKG